ncbi:hypothetical protein DPMN_055105 [Dreissena polymorpha]|uniref:Uncharacterized protein n=1 Tax=Dreissena polymorpha TaxID=45954 RepID=A0A9D4CR67_DREPO|nr:hypothetical protein DPMN_055105 [Dreissena polymorpha]
MNCIHETDAWWWHIAASLTMEKGDSYNAIAESYVDAVKGITDKRQWGSMSTTTVIITKTKRTGNVNHIITFGSKNDGTRWINRAERLKPLSTYGQLQFRLAILLRRLQENLLRATLAPFATGRQSKSQRGKKRTLEVELVLLKEMQSVAEMNAELEAFDIDDEVGKTDQFHLSTQTAEEKVVTYMKTCQDSSLPVSKDSNMVQNWKQ